MRTLRRLALVVALLLVLFFTRSLWLTALGTRLVKAGNPIPADFIVVLAGDPTGERILKAARIQQSGFAPKILVSGPGDFYGEYECDLAIPFAVRHGFPQSVFVPLPNHSKSTREEAEVIVAALRQQNARRVDIVTSDYHTRRSGNVYRKLAPDLDLAIVAAPDRYFTPDGWWKNREGQKTFLIEWMKTVAYWFGM